MEAVDPSEPEAEVAMAELWRREASRRLEEREAEERERERRRGDRMRVPREGSGREEKSGRAAVRPRHLDFNFRATAAPLSSLRWKHGEFTSAATEKLETDYEFKILLFSQIQ